MTSLERQIELLARIRHIWESARTQAARSVNTAHVCANWLIGRQIVEAEQRGAKRAAYGQGLLESLSKQLSADYGDGFSLSALKYMRLFFLGYPELLVNRHAVGDLSDSALAIRHAVRDESDASTAWQSGALHPALSWTHYRTLIKVGRREVRDFYEIESIRNGWSARQLERQINSFLFERLLKSRDKKGVMSLANEGQVLAQPSRICSSRPRVVASPVWTSSSTGNFCKRWTRSTTRYGCSPKHRRLDELVASTVHAVK